LFGDIYSFTQKDEDNPEDGRTPAEVHVDIIGSIPSVFGNTQMGMVI